jgi:hypothetical protein
MNMCTHISTSDKLGRLILRSWSHRRRLYVETSVSYHWNKYLTGNATTNMLSLGETQIWTSYTTQVIISRPLISVRPAKAFATRWVGLQIFVSLRLTYLWHGHAKTPISERAKMSWLDLPWCQRTCSDGAAVIILPWKYHWGRTWWCNWDFSTYRQQSYAYARQNFKPIGLSLRPAQICKEKRNNAEQWIVSYATQMSFPLVGTIFCIICLSCL